MAGSGGANVYVDLTLDEGLLYFVVCNDGPQAAHRVRVEFDKPLFGADGTDVSQLGIFGHLDFLAPGKRIPVFLDSISAYYARRQRSLIRLKVSWRVDQKPFGIAITHDMRAYADLPHIVTQPDPRRLGHPGR